MKFILGLTLLFSASAFATVECQAIVEDEITYTCEFGHYVSMGNGSKAGISGCMMEYSFNPASETRVEIDKGAVKVTRTEKGILVFSEKIEPNDVGIDGSVSLPNGTTIECVGKSEFKF